MSKVDLPENYIFENKINIRIDDINYGNHLDFAKTIALMANTRALFFKENNYPELSENGIGIITRDLKVSFKNQAMFGEQLYFFMGVSSIKGASVLLSYLVTKEDRKIAVAQGEITLVFLNYKTQRPCPVPEDFIDILNRAPQITP